MKSRDLQSEKSGKITREVIVYQCDCDDEKQIRVVYDGGFDEKYTVEYCKKCYDSDDKQFMISAEELF